MSRETWTDAMLLRALAMRDAGMTAAQVGRELGVTRAAVCRVLKRLDEDYRLSNVGDA